MFCTGNFMRKLRKATTTSGLNHQIKSEIAKIFDYDVVLVPFFYEEQDRNNMSTHRSNETIETPTPGENDYGSGTVLVAI